MVLCVTTPAAPRQYPLCGDAACCSEIKGAIKLWSSQRGPSVGLSVASRVERVPRYGLNPAGLAS